MLRAFTGQVLHGLSLLPHWLSNASVVLLGTYFENFWFQTTAFIPLPCGWPAKIWGYEPVWFGWEDGIGLGVIWEAFPSMKRVLFLLLQEDMICGLSGTCYPVIIHSFLLAEGHRVYLQSTSPSVIEPKVRLCTKTTIFILIKSIVWDLQRWLSG